MTKQEKLLAEEYRKRESREEKDRRAKENLGESVDGICNQEVETRGWRK